MVIRWLWKLRSVNSALVSSHLVFSHLVSNVSLLFLSFSFCLFVFIHVSLICLLFLMLSHLPCFCLILYNLCLTLSLLFVSNFVSCLISSLSLSGLLLFNLVLSHIIWSPIYFFCLILLVVSTPLFIPFISLSSHLILFCFSHGFPPHCVNCFSHLLFSHLVLSH